MTYYTLQEWGTPGSRAGPCSAKRAHGVFQSLGPKGHMKRRILHSGSETLYKGDSRKHSYRDFEPRQGELGLFGTTRTHKRPVFGTAAVRGRDLEIYT